MKTLIKFFGLGLILGSFVFLAGCGDDDDTGPEVINQPPAGTIDDQGLNPGFESATLDLTTFITDQENDPITFSAISSDQSVVTVSIDGSELTITEVGTGSAEIIVTASDGNDGNEVDFSFEVIIETITGAPDLASGTYDFLIDFNGVDNGQVVEGLIEGFGVEGLDENEETTDAFGSATIENNDHLLIVYNNPETVVEMGWFIEEEGPGLDFTGKKFRFDYAFFSGDLDEGDPETEEGIVNIEVFYADPSFEASFAGVAFTTLFPNGVENSSEWQTIEISVEDFVKPEWFEGEADPSNIGSFFFVMQGATEDNPISFRMDNLAIID